MVIFFLLLLKQLREVYHAYKENPNVYTVTKDKYLNCTCRESTYDGVPCSHELALCALKLKDSKLLYFAKRWEISYFNFEEIVEEEKKEEEEKEQNELEMEKSNQVF